MRKRLRDLGIAIGRLPAGEYNAITDVPGVLVGHTTLIYDAPRVARTGVTVILPREGAIWNDHAFGATHTLNGNGEMTGVHWIAESGMLTSPIAITNTAQVGTVHEALNRYACELGWEEVWHLPVVAETMVSAFILQPSGRALWTNSSRVKPTASGPLWQKRRA